MQPPGFFKRISVGVTRQQGMAPVVQLRGRARSWNAEVDPDDGFDQEHNLCARGPVKSKCEAVLDARENGVGRGLAIVGERNRFRPVDAAGKVAQHLSARGRFQKVDETRGASGVECAREIVEGAEPEASRFIEVDGAAEMLDEHFRKPFASVVSGS